jgi:serine/threonine-protein kinase
MSDLQSRLQAALGDAYQIERELGGGGMSRVFVARERALGRLVVVKVLPPEMAATVNIERFRREIQLAASLQHPHIVPVHAASQVGDLFYYTMPLVEGESLRAKLAREGELPIGDVIRILIDVVDGLAYAHAHGVVHRDIKPDNILISGNHAVVTDFGVAKAVSAATGESSLTSIGVALGTPAYMAPEQAAGRLDALDQRSDIYSLAIMFYEFLSLQHPRRHCQTVAHMIAEVVQTPIEKEQVLSDFGGAGAPGAFAHFVRHGLHHEPGLRYPSVAAMRARLDAVRDGQAPIECMATFCSRALNMTSHGLNRRPLLVVTLMATAALALLAVITVVVWSLVH